ncbi:IBR domain containing protein [Tritrichomonas foetus]|uniref:IBR domain containing protein n=1 Tax=Tritrichomonas foetus TaxID=1144522 RepID=A0A1J4KGB5_9EUKA|nr:IBR domain containing protein [Tritrichomonas foetus]|eukprot:OHT10082.1 IBR domain containing protein [Tritrichomonas foetus]
MYAFPFPNEIQNLKNAFPNEDINNIAQKIDQLGKDGARLYFLQKIKKKNLENQRNQIYIGSSSSSEIDNESDSDSNSSASTDEGEESEDHQFFFNSAISSQSNEEGGGGENANDFFPAQIENIGQINNQNNDDQNQNQVLQNHNIFDADANIHHNVNINLNNNINNNVNLNNNQNNILNNNFNNNVINNRNQILNRNDNFHGINNILNNNANNNNRNHNFNNNPNFNHRNPNNNIRNPNNLIENHGIRQHIQFPEHMFNLHPHPHFWPQNNPMGHNFQIYPIRANLPNQQQNQNPPQNQRELNKKNIKLFNINFTIIDEKQEILATIRRALEISKNFVIFKASTYVSMVLQHGEIPQDFLDRLVLAACDSNTTNAYSYREECEDILKNLFPSYRINDLRTECVKNSFVLDKTIDSIKQNHDLKKMNKPRNVKSNIQISDPIISMVLNEIFLEEEKERKIEEERLEEERQMKEAEENGSLMECECCFCDCPIDWMLQCPEGHLFCKKCVERQIETAISEGRANVPCLKFGGCESNISMNELERMIPPKTLERLIQTETLNAITLAELENTVKCHKCGFIVLYEGNGPMNCPVCKAQTCPKCGEVWHPDMTCEQMKEIDKNRLIEEKMNEAVVRTCPKCKTQFMKDEGCNKMECPRCHTWICYWCRQVIPKEVGYEHFWRQQGACPPDKCPLWVQNEALHLVEAERAKDEAEINLENGEKKNENEE